MKRIFIFLCVFFAAALAPSVGADDKHHKDSWADGEVRRVDKDAQKLTIRHGPLPNLDMPTAMTMVYRVKDAALLEKVKSGDKVKFQAEKANGAFTVTAIEPAK
jgi:Cu/Ag efflux protein CusF